MIDNIDDLLTLARDILFITLHWKRSTYLMKIDQIDDKACPYLTLRDNDFTSFLLNLIDSGYEPSATYDLGNVSGISVEFNDSYFIVKTSNCR